ncbi:hypothetical protein ES703_111463 [subsurface metagenome]
MVTLLIFLEAEHLLHWREENSFRWNDSISIPIQKASIRAIPPSYRGYASFLRRDKYRKLFTPIIQEFGYIFLVYLLVSHSLSLLFNKVL